ERFRAVLHEGSIGKRTQFVIEGLFALRKAGFESQGHAPVAPELDLVEAEDQITHELGLEDELDLQPGLDVFQLDERFQEHEQEYAAIRREILGEDGDEEGSGDESGSGSGSEQDEPESEDSDAPSAQPVANNRASGIADLTSTDLVNLRRTIYLTIMSALDFEEAGHKLLKLGIPEGSEHELCTMVLECCSQERTFVRYYALLGERFCKLRRAYCQGFAEAFVQQYALVHRLETGKLRNVARFFAHLLASDALPWEVFACVVLTEEATTSSSRIFVKILFQDLAEHLGLADLDARLAAPELRAHVQGLFPADTARNMRFAINFFTSIGLGGLTDRMRDELKVLAARQAEARAKE
ncbi:hypothetical protein H632_c3655p0, partial [Helicosporidium sp. ATCC 50920]